MPLKSYPYKRTVLYRDSRVEIVRIVWPPGVESLPHDHGKSYGITKVVAGIIFQDIFSKKTKRFLEHTKHKQNEVLFETPDVIHIMGNPSKKKAAETIHIYSPRLKMAYYKKTELRYPKNR